MKEHKELIKSYKKPTGVRDLAFYLGHTNQLNTTAIPGNELNAAVIGTGLRK